MKIKKQKLNEGDYGEGSMARGQLARTAEQAIMILNMITDDTDLEEWVESKITKSQDYLSSVLNYMKGKAMTENKMKLSKSKLKQIIKEELSTQLEEGSNAEIDWSAIDVETVPADPANNIPAPKPDHTEFNKMRDALKAFNEWRDENEAHKATWEEARMRYTDGGYRAFTRNTKEGYHLDVVSKERISEDEMKALIPDYDVQLSYKTTGRGPAGTGKLEEVKKMKLSKSKLKQIIKEELENALSEEEEIFAPNHYCVKHGGVNVDGEIKEAKAVAHNWDEELNKVTHYDMQLEDGTILENVSSDDIMITQAVLERSHGSHTAKKKKK